MQAYNDKPTAENLRNWTAAKQAIEAFTRKSDSPERRFDNLMDVCEYLTSEGWKISKTKLYEDQGKIHKQKDGTMLKQDVDRYAAVLSRLDGSDFEGHASEKLRWETEIAKQKAKLLTRSNAVEAGKYILKSDVEQQLAGRASYLKSSLGMDFIHSRAAQLIRVCDGNQERAPELIEFWLEQIEQTFDHYAQPLQFSTAYAAVGTQEDEA